jgi:hypothetical protein
LLLCPTRSITIADKINAKSKWGLKQYWGWYWILLITFSFCFLLLNFRFKEPPVPVFWKLLLWKDLWFWLFQTPQRTKPAVLLVKNC